MQQWRYTLQNWMHCDGIITEFGYRTLVYNCSYKLEGRFQLHPHTSMNIRNPELCILDVLNDLSLYMLYNLLINA